jgi:hypothetical protein
LHSAFAFFVNPHSLWMHTMKRWILATLLATSALAAFAQTIRYAPADVKPAMLTVTAPPEITLDGQPDRLSPGSRIRNTNNLLLLSGSVVGQQLPVVYRRDSAGLVHEVWVLTEAEYARIGGSGGDRQGGKRFEELLNFIFGARVRQP